MFLGVFVAILAMDAMFAQPVSADGGGLLGGDSPLGLLGGGTEEPAAPPEQPAEAQTTESSAQPVLNLATNTLNSVGEALNPQQTPDTSDAAQPAAETSQAILGTAGQPLVQAVEPVVQAIEPVVQTVEPAVQAVEPVVAALEPVILAAEPVLDAVEPVVQAVEPVLDAVVEPVVQTVAPVIDAVVEPVVQTVAPVIDAVVEPVAQTVAPVLDAVVEPVAQTAAPILAAALPVLEGAQVAAEPAGTAGANFAMPGPLGWAPDDVAANGGAIGTPDTSQSAQPASNPSLAVASGGPTSGPLAVRVPTRGGELESPRGLALGSAAPAENTTTERPYGPADPAPRFNPLAFLAGSGALTAPGGGSSVFAAVLASSLLVALALVASKRVCLDALRLPTQGYAPLLPPG